MKALRRGVVVAALATVTLSGLAAPAAMAEAAGPPPVMTETHLQVVQTDPAACGSYGVEWNIDLHAKNWTYYDEQGRRTKLVRHVTEDNTVRNTVTGLTLPDSPVNFEQTATYDPATQARRQIWIVGTSVSVRRGDEHLVDRGPILIDGPTGKILWSQGPHPVREQMDGSFDIREALPAFCEILR